MVHVFVQIAQILAQVVDGNAGRLRGWRSGIRFGDRLAPQSWRCARATPIRNSPSRARSAFDAEQIGVEIPLGNPVADLSGQPGIQLVFGDCLQHGAALICGRLSGSYAMFTVCVAIDTLWIFSHGILK